MAEAGVEPLPARRLPGRRVVLLILFLCPIIIVPLLLTGWSHERQVDLVTLEQRERRSFVVGSIAVSEGEWHPVQGHPEIRTRRRLPAELRADDPRTAQSAVHRWVAVERSLPFAFFVEIPNTRAIAPWHEDLYLMQMAGAVVLDAEAPEDAACAARLKRLVTEDKNLTLAGDELTEPRVRGRGRNRQTTENEARAGDLVEKLIALAGGEDIRARARELLCGAPK